MSYKDLISNVLSRVERPGDFCSSGKLQCIAPTVDVKKVGTLALPLEESQAQKLRETCSAAPYGRKEETIYDDSVRKTWQLNPSQFKLKDLKEWNQTMRNLMKKIRLDLGLPEKSAVKHKLYKLLLYDVGSFFKPHRDTEKVPGMFATLVICLPSKFSGGELAVNHMGDTRTIDFAEKSDTEVQFAVFYADCLHEVKELTSGYRFCLVYNLFYTAGKETAIPQPPDNSSLLVEAVKALEQAEKEAEKTIVLLNHKYSQAALSFERLKNDDRAMVDFLCRACDRMGKPFHIFLAIYSREEMGGGDMRSDYFDPCESTYEISDFVSRDGTGFDFDLLKLDSEKEITGYLDPKAYDRQEKEEATGNEGTTVERWYNRAVLVIVPQSKMLHIQGRQNYSDMNNTVAEKVRNGTHLSDAKVMEECKKTIICLLDLWSSDCNIFGEKVRTSVTDIRLLLDTLVRFEDKLLLQRFFNSFVEELGQNCSGYLENKELMEHITFVCDKFGVEHLTMALENLDNVTERYNLRSYMKLINTLSTSYTNQNFIDIKKNIFMKFSKLCKHYPCCVDYMQDQICPESKTYSHGYSKENVLALPSDFVVQSVTEGMEGWMKGCRIQNDNHYWAYSTGEVIKKLLVMAHYMKDSNMFQVIGDNLLSVMPLKNNEPIMISVAKDLNTKFHSISPYCQQLSVKLLAKVYKGVKQQYEATSALMEEPWLYNGNMMCKNQCDNCKKVQKFLLDQSKPKRNFKVSTKERRHIEDRLSKSKVNVVCYMQNCYGSIMLCVKKMHAKVGVNQLAKEKQFLKEIAALLPNSVIMALNQECDNKSENALMEIQKPNIKKQKIETAVNC